jgi:hypothetical protein
MDASQQAEHQPHRPPSWGDARRKVERLAQLDAESTESIPVITEEEAERLLQEHP